MLKAKKVALVTGASSDIGAVIVRDLLAPIILSMHRLIRRHGQSKKSNQILILKLLLMICRHQNKPKRLFRK